jgi:hypothetical protein
MDEGANLRQYEITSIRRAAAVCNVTPPVIRRWISIGLLTGPPWTLQQLHQIRDETDPHGRRRGPQVPHGTLTRWLEGCDCERCHKRRTTPQGHASDARRKNDSRPTYANSYWMRSTADNRSGRRFGTSA